jgi:O-antigen ligase/polysaccharide polymerase Wzy-like membrane protein
MSTQATISREALPQEPSARVPSTDRLREAGWSALMLLPGAMIVFLGFRSGGFYEGATSLAAAEMALVLGLRFVLSKRPLQGVSAPLVIAAAAIGLFAAWTLLSANWSDSVARALPAYSRALLFGLTLFFSGTLPFKPNRIRWIVYGVLAATMIICGAAIIARLLPHVILDPQLVQERRLAYPLTYWNALGIFACVGVVLSAHVACSTRDAPLARVLAAACVPLLGLTLYYTLSRGGIWAAPAALVVYALVGRPRALLSGAIAIVPTSAIALLQASPSSSVSESYPFGMVATGEHIALVLAGCMVGAAVLRAALLPLDKALDRMRLPERAREPLLVGSVIAGVCLVLAVGAVAHVPNLVSTKYHEFTDRRNTSPASGEGRLLSARPEGRFELWDVALAAYRSDPFHGTGAGTYVLRWDKERESGSNVQNAHSLYLEVLGEFGIVGLALLVAAIGLILGAFAYRARGPDRALFAALLAAGLVWAIHAGVDWDWQMPAVDLWFFALGGAALARSLRWRRRRSSNELKRTLLRAGGAVACLCLVVVPAQVAISQARLNSAISAMKAGHCATAQAEADSALSAVSQRPAPYAVIAYCDIRRGRYGSATVALRRALQRDPGNWELYYGLAVSRAGVGLDPRPAARKAAELNPNETLAQTAPARFRGRGKRAWQIAARNAPLIPPTPGDP